MRGGQAIRILIAEKIRSEAPLHGIFGHLITRRNNVAWRSVRTIFTLRIGALPVTNLIELKIQIELRHAGCNLRKGWLQSIRNRSDGWTAPQGRGQSGRTTAALSRAERAAFQDVH